MKCDVLKTLNGRPDVDGRIAANHKCISHFTESTIQVMTLTVPFITIVSKKRFNDKLMVAIKEPLAIYVRIDVALISIFSLREGKNLLHMPNK